MKHLQFVLKNLGRNRRRSVLLFLSIAVSFFLVATLRTTLTELSNPPETPSAALRLIVRHHISMFNVLPQVYRKRIAAIDGVDGVIGSTYYGAQYKDPSNFLSGFAVDTDGFFHVYSDLILSDEQQRAFLADRAGAIVGNKLAERLKWTIGDRVFLKSKHWPVDLEVNVRGIYRGGSDQGAVFYFHSEYLNELLSAKMGEWDNAGAFMLRARSQQEVVAIGDHVDALFRNSAFPTKTETERVFTLSYLSMFGDVGAYVMSIVSVVMFTVILMTANAMTMAIKERTREVGVLKTLGYRSSHVFSLLLAEVAILSASGAAVGAGGAKLLFGAVDMTQVTSGFIHQFHVTFTTLIGCVFAALVAGVLASGVQAWQASRMTVLDALRRVL